jgi:putative Ca2+/H+ antiporter (TMEM165/GDT1 family)
MNRLDGKVALITGASSALLGMMLANVPAVILGDKLAARLPVEAIRITAALVFAALGGLTLAGVGE